MEGGPCNLVSRIWNDLSALFVEEKKNLLSERVGGGPCKLVSRSWNEPLVFFCRTGSLYWDDFVSLIYSTPDAILFYEIAMNSLKKESSTLILNSQDIENPS